MVNYGNKPHDDINSVCSTANRREKEEPLFMTRNLMIKLTFHERQHKEKKTYTGIS